MKKYIDIIRPWKLVILGVIFFLMFFDMLFAGSAMPIIIGILGVLSAIIAIIYSFFNHKMNDGLKNILGLIIYVCYPLISFLIYLVATIATGNTYEVLEWIMTIVLMVILLGFVVISILDFFNVKGMKKVSDFSVKVIIGAFVFLLIANTDGSFRTIGGIRFVEVALYAILFSIFLFDKPVRKEKENEEEKPKEIETKEE